MYQCVLQCRKTYCWSFNSPIILMCKSFGQRLIDNHLWRSKSRRQLLNIGCHKNSLQSWRIGPFLNTCSSLDLSNESIWLCSCKLMLKANSWGRSKILNTLESERTGQVQLKPNHFKKQGSSSSTYLANNTGPKWQWSLQQASSMDLPVWTCIITLGK